jgi:hypothetical protein
LFRVLREYQRNKGRCDQENGEMLHTSESSSRDARAQTKTGARRTPVEFWNACYRAF